MVFTRVVPIGSPACARSLTAAVPRLAAGTAALVVALVAAHGPARGTDTAPENSERAGAPLPPEEARAAVTVRLPARLTVLASEPLIANPVAATVDSAGRLLVAENLTYAERPLRTDTRWHDRVTLLEDADGDGVAEHHAVIVDGLTGLTSLSIGRGGLWLLCPPRLLFIRDGHRPPPGWPDSADGAEPRQRAATAETVLDGFTVSPNSHHTFANGLSWGPDGWLYGRCGASSPGEIGPPGSAPGERVPLRGGMWRYHPERRAFEAICHGTTNPWGHDWDDRGEGFFVNTVNGHLWRILPGAHYARSHTVEPHPFVTEPLGHHADHQHFDDARHWTESRDGKADAHGGGHAHAGCVIVPDEPGWPGELRGRLLTLNLHGRRINVDRLDHTPQGIVGRHEDDLAIFGDPFFRGIDVVELPGRALAILDWSDTGECHEATGVHRTSGRVYRLGLGTPPAPEPTIDLADLPTADLVARLTADRWQARIALRLLADRRQAAPRQPLPADARVALERLLRDGATSALRLRGLWGLWAGADLPIGRLLPLLDDAEPAIRTWAIRLLTDEWPLDFATGAQPHRSVAPAPEVLERLVHLASGERDPDVRLALATVLQRLPARDRALLAAALVGHVEDQAAAATRPARGDDALPAGPLGGDHHDLGAMVWFGILPAIPADPGGTVAVWDAAAVTGAEEAHWPGLRRDIVRRATADDAADTLTALLGAAAGGGAVDLDDCLAGLQAGWKGLRQVAAPPGWERIRSAALAVPHRDGLRVDRVVALDATLDRPGSSEALAALALDPALPVARRAAALDALADVRGAGLEVVSGALLEVAGLEYAALRGLAVAGEPAGAERIVAALARFDTVLRARALQALVSRREWAAALATAVEQGSVPRTDLGPDLLRQVRAFRDAALDRRFDALVATRAPGEARAPIDVWRSRLAAVPAPADPAAGRLIWERRCASCHRLHGEGGTLGPDLTGSGRRDPDYLLAAIVTPSAVVSPDYRLRQVILTDGRVLAGLLLRRTREGIVLRSTGATETIAAVDIDEVRDTGVSLMPEGLLDGLSDIEVRDLFAFLGGG